MRVFGLEGRPRRVPCLPKRHMAQAVFSHHLILVVVDDDGFVALRITSPGRARREDELDDAGGDVVGAQIGWHDLGAGERVE